MQYREYGNHGFKVSALGFGASHIGSDACSEPEADQMLNMVLDHGVTLLDTARGYGSSEERIGKFISHRRDEFVLSTKCGYGIDGVQDWTAECITKGIDEALSRMKTDYIDIMHFHSCPMHTLEQDDVRQALVAAKDAGKIRVAAYSGENEERSFAIECDDFGGIQTSINICEQGILAGPIDKIISKGTGLIAKRPIANAFWRFAEQPCGDYSEAYWLRAKELNLAPPENMEWLEYALRFMLSIDGLSSMIVGTRSMENFKNNCAHIAKGPLDSEIVEALRNRYSEVGSHWRGEV